MKKTPTYKITLWPYGLESGGPDAMIGYSTDYGKYFEIHLQWGKAGLLPYADVCVITSVYIYIEDTDAVWVCEHRCTVSGRTLIQHYQIILVDEFKFGTVPSALLPPITSGHIPNGKWTHNLFLSLEVPPVHNGMRCMSGDCIGSWLSSTL